MKTKRIHVNIINAAASVITAAAIILSMLFLVQAQYKQLNDQAKSYLQISTEETANAINASIGYAFNSIQVTSSAVSSGMTKDIIDEPSSVLSQYIGQTPFSSIEYIRADGMNITDAGDPFDASEREYYINGMKGITGIWVNFTPKYSDEPLLNFYTPLYYNGNIVGVITGTMGGNTDIRPIIVTEFSGQQIFGILLDENNRIISCSNAFKTGASLSFESTQYLGIDMTPVFSAINTPKGGVFTFDGATGQGLGSAVSVGNTGYRLLKIVSSESLKKITSNTNRTMYFSFGLAVAAMTFLYIVLVVNNYVLSSEDIKQANSEKEHQFAILKSMAEIYYSMHLIDLEHNTFEEYEARNEVKTTANDSNKEADKIMQAVMHATVSDDHLNMMMDFSDLKTVREKMHNQKIISKEFLGKNVGWTRLSFITIEADDDGFPLKVICTTQIIDNEKTHEELLIRQSNTDEMTGCFNRRAYENEITRYRENGTAENFVYAAIDINGLKVVNDTLGHNAGDELIQGAARCLKKCLGNYGNIFRTGGDEFVALFFATEKELDRIKTDLEDTTDSWSGNYVDSLSLSCGFVTRREMPDSSVIDISKAADERMYEIKAAHYRKLGVDRRGQKEAHTALTNLYTKILKINLSDDSYQIVNVDSSEKTSEKGFADSISGWLRSFGETGQVHPDDLKEYLEKTDISYMNDYFRNYDDPLHVFYRRKYGDTFKFTMMEIIPANDYTDDNQSLFLYVKDIDK